MVRDTGVSPGAATSTTDAADAAEAAVPTPITGVAATVVVLRDGPAGPEVLLLERPRHRGSFAGAWVFPGGSVDPEDRVGDDAGSGEEPGVRRAAVREVREEAGLELPPDSLVALSCWVPPEGIPKRLRTWFFLAPDPGGPLILAPEECVDSAWLRPLDALDRHASGELRLVPPTWVTLTGLAGRASVAEILAGAREPEQYATRAGTTVTGTTFFWAGDVAAADDALAEADGGRHRLEVGALPWVYQRSGVGGAR
ncbi:NUDIX hydrolase [Cryobacterium frigoriphilum]|uniref:NUDIX hydrolase n=1 Tax=Cryobacterium frigoriphilum TaxID=1259150 RepID=A0A4V6QIC2_9MICO|nr:NUDIX hydrolase [Cryobacterium frigoriphilum]TFD54564.1 NUDIX hydrolase [Cryobacterium frigoriphilum]